MNEHNRWIEHVIRMAEENARMGEGPFAAILVRGDEIVGSGVNSVRKTKDPSSHAELQAVRDACARLDKLDLSDCELYASGEPCPMCMGAIYWANVGAVYYACSKKEAAADVGFGDPLAHFSAELGKTPEERSIAFRTIPSERRLEPFRIWAEVQRENIGSD